MTDLRPAASKRYSAPALEKGLDILELMAATKSPMTLSQIGDRLGRSINELFRMVQVLDTQGYLVRDRHGDGYELTSKLFSLALATPASQRLLSRAIPLMQDLSDATQQACHLAVATSDQMVVIARMESPGDLGFSVRVGFRRKIVDSTSGVVLYAFRRPHDRDAWRRELQPATTPAVWDSFAGRVRQAVQHGYATAPSGYTTGIVDISCPVFDSDGLAAALTMPLIRNRLSAGTDDCLTQLRQTATRLSHALDATVHRRPDRIPALHSEANT